MILTIHDNNLQKVAFIDNNKQGTLNFYNDKWTRYLSKASSLFEFTVFKQTIQTDIVPYQTANALNDRSFVSFVYKGRTYLFNVMTIEETEHTITCTCKDLNLELTNEYTNPFKSNKARTFKEYCDVMGLLEFATLRIGVNEISDQKRTLGWEGQDTKLNRILSLANKFDAEVDFEVKLNANGTIKDFILNVYREHDDKHQGVGKVRSDIILKKGKNIRSIKRKIDKTDLIVNAIRPTAQGENGQEITIAGLGPWEVKNENGVVEFFQQGDMIYAPISMQKYPSTWTVSTGNRDKYTRKDITVDTKSKETLRIQAYKELMRSAYPSVTYEIDGYVDLEIGDTAKVYNGDFYPALLLEVRVSEQTISFTKPSTNKTVFDNVRALKSKLSNGIQERWQELFEASKPYLIKLATDNGVIFKNGTGQSIVTPTLYKGGRPITANVTWRWSLDGAVKTGMTYTVRGADVTDTSTLTVAAYIGNDEVAVDELTFVNVLDGRDGPKGEKGDPGRFEGKLNFVNLVRDSKISQTSSTYGFGKRSVWLEAGKTYQLVARAKRTGGTAENWARVYLYEPSWSKGGIALGIDSNEYKVVSATIPIEWTGEYFLESYWGPNGNNATGSMSVDWYMIVESDLAPSHWSPHPEDPPVLKLGGKNYFRNSNFKDGLKFWENNTASPDLNLDPQLTSQVKRVGALHVDTGDRGAFAHGFYQIVDMPLSANDQLTVSFDVAAFPNNDAGLLIIVNNHLFDVRKEIPATEIPKASSFGPTSLKRKSVTLTIPQDCDRICCIIIFGPGTVGNMVFTDLQIEHGIYATDHSLNSDELSERLDSKADQTLTQGQLNALNERAQILDAELKAKASMDALSDLEKAYQSFVKSNADSQAKAEADLAEAGRRIELLVTQFGGFKELKTFIDTYMSSSNEGLIIGKNDASSTIKVSHDRISMFSAGKEVMYISQGVIHIDNGIFTASVQIGRFRTEQYHLNADMNVVRYVW
ncbi:TPA: hypothetical protein ACGO4O_000763 [Streptococcus suis]